ncbi:MAG: GAF domain-containing protein [Chloroflexi bacterium]|nr:GAF domain-containing protein [Chloroflexota bacterium]
MSAPPFLDQSGNVWMTDFPEPLTTPEAISTRDAMEELRRRYAELATLYATGARLNAIVEWHHITHAIVDAAIHLGKADGATLLLVDESTNELHIAAARDLPDSVVARTRIKFGEGVVGWVAEKRQPLLLLGALNADEYPHAHPKPNAIGSSICVPLLIAPSLTTLGVLCLSRRVSSPWFTHAEMRVVEALSHQASVALQNARTHRRLQRRALQMENLVEISASLIATLEVDSVLHSIIDKAVELLHCEAGSLLLVDPETGGLVFKVATGPAGSQLIGTKLPPGAGIVGTVMREGKPLIVNDAKSDPRHYGDVDESTQRITQSLLCVPLKNQSTTLGVIEIMNKLDGTPFGEDDSELLVAFAIQGTIALENARLYSELRRSFTDIVRIIANAVEARDPYTAGHTSRVTDIALETARELGWSREQLDTLEGGALLHDIGKIGIRDIVLRKPSGLTDDEYAEMKQHPIVGAQMLEGVAALRLMLPYVLYHQERYDGKGYPFGLAGKEIPLEGRLLAVVDTFDAMTSDRPYRKGLSVETAVAEILRNRGTQFDPDVVDALLRVHAKGKLYPAIMEKEL